MLDRGVDRDCCTVVAHTRSCYVYLVTINRQGVQNRISRANLVVQQSYVLP